MNATQRKRARQAANPDRLMHRLRLESQLAELQRDMAYHRVHITRHTQELHSLQYRADVTQEAIGRLAAEIAARAAAAIAD